MNPPSQPRPPSSRGVAAQLWESIPDRNDLRWIFASILSLYGVLGFSIFGFNRTPLQMGLIVASGCLLDMALSRLANRPFRFPLSAYISCASLALLLNYAHGSAVLLYPVLLAIGSKYVFTFEGRHVFNPSLFGVAMSLLLANDVITTAPAYQWAGGEMTLSFAMIALACITFFSKIKKGWLVSSFLVFYAIQTAIRAVIMRHHIPAPMLFWGTITTPGFFLFVFYMLTDPATSPKTRAGQIQAALAITLIDLYWHLHESVFTFFYAALAFAACKFLWLHLERAYQQRSRPRALVTKLVQPRDIALRLALCVAALWATSAVRHASKQGFLPEDIHFQLSEVPPSVHGIQTHMGKTLQEVDPRVEHVSKWILSVGSSISVGDINNDGLMDVVLTSPLAVPEERIRLFLNRGAFAFEQQRVDELERFEGPQATHGLPSGSNLVDIDGDGDLDLTIAVSFGPSLVLLNQLAQSGQLAFVDATEAMGLVGHHTSIHAGWLDVNQDTHLDLLIANVIPTHLPGYKTSTPFNLFDLPQPKFPGDRRALRFMHDGWHNANNGGVNELYLGNAALHFQRSQALPPETRWSLAACYTDIDQDGWTDIYIANDFGPDRIYRNLQGKSFESMQGQGFGDYGNDTYKGMNCSVGDVNNDLRGDIYVSNVHHPLQAEGSLLWINRSDAKQGLDLRNEAVQRNALNEHRFGWGAGFGDLNNDGWIDLVQGNGMVDDRLDPKGYARKDYWYVNHKLMQSGPDVHTYADMWGDIRGREIFPNEARRVYLNHGQTMPGVFGDVADKVGLTHGDNTRGVALVDFDNDGDLDLLLANQHGNIHLHQNTLRDQKRSDTHYLSLELVGDGIHTHRAALGTQVIVSYEKDGQRKSQWRERSSSSGLSAQADPRFHFGLGDYKGKVHVEIHWYGAKVQHLELTTDQHHRITQGSQEQP